MLLQNLKGAFRSIEREKLNAAVALLGLGIGIMAVMLTLPAFGSCPA